MKFERKQHCRDNMMQILYQRDFSNGSRLIDFITQRIRGRLDHGVFGCYRNDYWE